MSKIDRKMAVFEALTNTSLPLTSADLLKILGEDVPVRSLRRCLSELVEAGAVRKVGTTKGARYIARHPKPSHENLQMFTSASENALAYVKQPIYLRKPSAYQDDWLMQYKPNIDFYLSEVQRTHLLIQGQRTEFGPLAGTYARHIYNRLLIDLSFNSSRLEGNTYSLLDTEKLLINGVADENKMLEETTMILNHKEAIRYIVDNASKISIAPEFINTIHYLLSDGLLPNEHCGTLRNHAVKIGGSTYLPIEHLDALSRHLKIICDKANNIQDPFEQSFFLLVHLAYLQGFEDCNKRTSRLSANIPLIQKNLVPLSFNEIPKDAYINAMLSIYELNDIHPLADLYCFSYERTCHSYDANAQVMGFDRLRVIYREHRREIIRNIIIQHLHGTAMEKYIIQQADTIIPEPDRFEFIKVVHEDIKLLSVPRIAGMGISIADFNSWKSG